MPEARDNLLIPASRAPNTLLAIDRAVSELRRGNLVAMRGARGKAALMLAAEAVTPETMADLIRSSMAQPVLVITSRRAAHLNIGVSGAKVVSVTAEPPLSVAHIRDIADPVTVPPSLRDLRAEIEDAEPHGCESAAVELAKVARLLPAALVSFIQDPEAEDLEGWAARRRILTVDTGDVFQYDYISAQTLRRVSEASVPLVGAENTRVIAFRPLDGGLEHLAIVIGEPSTAKPVLTRIHSECFTGDLLGSLRCDCGDQLRGAIQEISRSGDGLLLYLAQEGRGIGLVNKLRAYQLQDGGVDTLDANEMLGFDADERVYLPAARMLRALGYSSVRLMTNNPEKVAALSRCGVQVIDRVDHSFPSNRHNELYLQTKRARGGHLF